MISLGTHDLQRPDCSCMLGQVSKVALLLSLRLGPILIFHAEIIVAFVTPFIGLNYLRVECRHNFQLLRELRN